MKWPAILLTLLFFSFRLFAQILLGKNIISLTPKDGKISTVQLQSMINDMGNFKIVGLGEGTHGTKEFNELRIGIIKELIEKKDSVYFALKMNCARQSQIFIRSNIHPTSSSEK